MGFSDSSIYLDYQATTPVDERVLEAMVPYFTQKFGNPHSATHAYGWRAEAAVDTAKDAIATIIGASAKEIIITSGATESNNLSLKGVVLGQTVERRHIITVVTEHKCVLESAAWLERMAGATVTYLTVPESGIISADDVVQAMTEQTCLVSVMAVHNEIGVIQPLAEIGAVCRERGVWFHTDAAQAFGKIPLDVQAMNIDLMSISGHKIYGPAGIGAVYVRRRPKVILEPLFSGGGQQGGIRPGTVPLALTVGLGEAARIAQKDMEADRQHIEALRDLFWQEMASVEGISVNGDVERRWPGNINIAFDGIEGRALLMELKGLAVSSGSACASAEQGHSYVLEAIGVPATRAVTALRFGLGRMTTQDEVVRAATMMKEALAKLKQKAA